MTLPVQDPTGLPSWRVAGDRVEAFLCQTGCQLGPVRFDLGGRSVFPFYVAPWHAHEVEGPPVIQALRGDFFCMPFGANETAYGDEQHPLHGETANEVWTEVGPGEYELATSIRKSKVRRSIGLGDGEANLYVRNTVSGLSGPMCLGNHAMLDFKSSGLLSTSPFQFGQVFPGQFEDPAKGGYSSLARGERFHRLEIVPMENGSIADLSRYPDREGFEDLVMLVGTTDSDFAWNAVVFPEEGYLWFCLKNPRVLQHTILWHSNGGRHYAPWNGRHRNVLGIEDVTAYFHYGLAESCGDNPLSREGIQTCLDFVPEQSLKVSTIMGVIAVGNDADHVEAIEPTGDGIDIHLRSGETLSSPCDIDFLYG